ncbi:Peptidyl-prolyl cis-trans isomerase-like 2 [Phytophthora cactorum]|nr:Peptidyl-prolyl cis-trans isomerase-like 2 [Phytophthora cactorum]
MGKNRHSKDRLFITQTEHKYLYGGKKQEIRRAYKRLPFNCCAITLCPFANPVCSREGHLFDLEAVVPYVKKHQINPVTGKPLALKELIQLHFSKNSQGEYFCPVTYKVFTDNTKIAAIATTGNVFCYEAIEELNIKPKNWTDLISGAKFKRKDIIILQDPQDFSNREIENFEHLRRAKASEHNASTTTPARNIRTNAATDRILHELEAKRAAQKDLADKIKRGADGVSEKDKIVASLTHSNMSKEEEATANKTTGSGKLQYSQFTAGECSSSFTSSVRAPVTNNAMALASEQELLERRWQAVRKLKKKGLVRLETTFGEINLEVDCDFVPQTADNFMSLCQKKYYDGVVFHRVIKGFMMQGGDPTGTGRGGESIWKKPFRDEIDSRLSHDSRGVLSMANSGPGTNNSQFFITFKACPHLDKKHAVFGRVVGGMDVLDAVEHAEIGAEDRPIEDVRIKNVQVFANPFQEYEEALAQGLDVVQVAKEKAIREAKPQVQGTVLKVGGKWVAYDDLGEVDVASIPTSETTKDENVGKYLKPKSDATLKKRSLEPAVPVAIESKKKSKKQSSSGFGNFSQWERRDCSMDKYVVEKVIGEGTYGIVYKAKEKASGDYVAIKKFKSTGDEQLSKREIQACSMLSHPYIVSYRNSFRHEGLLHLVFDFVCESMVKLLSKNKKGIKPQEAKIIIFQLCKALEYCHSNRIIHRDIKPDNILIDENGDIKLCDFGVARTVQFEGDPLSDYVSTRWYRPPEQELRLDRYSFDADIWSVGCVLMELLTGRPLFPGNTQIEQINLIQSYLGPLPAALHPRVPRGVASVQTASKSFQELLGDRPLPEGTLDFLVSTLQLEPRLRMSAKQCLEHPFLKPLRDAELRDREKRRRSGRASRLSDDEGIEEDIPGEGQPSSRVHQEEFKADQKVVGIESLVSPFKSGLDFKHDDEKGTSSVASAKSKQPRRMNGRSPNTYDNNTEWDSDDIQEIIETEEADSLSRSRTRQHGDSIKSECKLLGNVPPSKGVTRRRSLMASAKADVDPLDGDSCYDDDFEEYHNGYE